ncbi:hypothetical protein B296_00014517 [Ensete ventricosum]|uniref:Serine-threonine/tyrosine-protein kinase catalytic domain-containing protein n=1 Tax=Ensete ventricosum TaxID=4639 RepID=A0A427ARQ2_ENSVE|nr:hypothetical protein B296_00014517 [Ensete ventricosum]
MACQSSMFSIIDNRMGSYPSECIEKFVSLALRCCQDETDARPSMKEVVRELETIWGMTPEAETTASESTATDSERLPTAALFSPNLASAAGRAYRESDSEPSSSYSSFAGLFSFFFCARSGYLGFSRTLSASIETLFSIRVVPIDRLPFFKLSLAPICCPMMEASGRSSNPYRSQSSSSGTGSSRWYRVQLLASNFIRSRLSDVLDHFGVLRPRASHAEDEGLVGGESRVHASGRIDGSAASTGSGGEVSIRIIGVGDQESLRVGSTHPHPLVVGSGREGGSNVSGVSGVPTAAFLERRGGDAGSDTVVGESASSSSSASASVPPVVMFKSNDILRKQTALKVCHYSTL